MKKYDFQKTIDPERLRRPIYPEKFNGMLINPDFKNMLQRFDFTNFESIFHFSGGDVFKKIKERSVTRIDLPVGRRINTFYLKRHNAEKIKRRPHFFSKSERGRSSQGMLEFQNIIDFRRHGLAAATPVASGEKKIGSSHTVSFIMTEDFSPYVSLEHLLFNHPDFFSGPGAGLRKKVLLEKIGNFARKMHESGFNHMDFNATHILLGFPENLSGTPEIALFDLQRVDRQKLFRFRWVIKSLAELNYTLLEEYFSRAERSRFFLAYKKKKKMEAYDYFQHFWIRRKTARIARHTENIKKRRKSSKVM